MNYTWGDVQIIAVEKMFLNNVPVIVSDLTDMREDKKYKTYLGAMPNVANEGLLRLMTNGKPYIRKYTFNQNIPADLLNATNYETHQIIDADYEYEVGGATSYYFEVDNDCTVDIKFEIDGVWTVDSTITVSETVTGTYEAHRDFINNPQGYNIKLVFKADTLYNVRNVAMYNIPFKSKDDIFINAPVQRYNLKTLISDFYEIVSVEYQENDNGRVYTSSYTLEGDNYLIVETGLTGNFIITYSAYPDKITSSTADTYVFNLPSEMIALLPLYIASESYKDDDISLATQYRNQFEVGLQNITKPLKEEEFVDTAGWL